LKIKRLFATMTIKAESSKASPANTTDYGSIPQQDPEELPVAEAVPVFEGESVKQDDRRTRTDDLQQQQQQQQRNTGSSGRSDESFGLLCLLAFIVIGALLCLVSPTVPGSPSSSSVVTPSPPSPSSVRKSNPVVPPPVQPPPAPPPAPPLPKVIASLDLPRQGPLMDLIHIVDDDSVARILSEISAVQQDVPGCEVQVLLVDNIQEGWWLNPKEFATALFNTWALSNIDTNNGVLILFLLDARRIEVAVGANLDAYMDQAWTTAMLYRRAVPEFKRENYGFGIYNVVMSVTDRLRDIEHGIAVPYGEPKSSYNDDNKNYAPPSDQDMSDLYVILSVLASLASCACCCSWYDSSYPMGQNRFCTGCGQSNWQHQRWDYARPATYQSQGLKRRYCICKQCQTTDYLDHTIPVLTQSNDANNNGRGGGGGGGGGGHSSGGGGGGASW
jgi:uncharacterized membrane protein YgcG